MVVRYNNSKEIALFTGYLLPPHKNPKQNDVHYRMNMFDIYLASTSIRVMGETLYHAYDTETCYFITPVLVQIYFEILELPIGIIM